MSKISAAESGALVETFSLETTQSGPLAGLTFAVKDLIDIAGHATGCGNPTWRDTHPPAKYHAVVVEQLLASGARCVGKAVTDELAFSLIGDNHFYGTPLNPKAPSRVPGGSSSGSASAVACGLADFALGTDTGGSVRVPASNCGVWGLRPSHGFISVAGVMPFAPTFDSIGMLASTGRVLEQAAAVLLGEQPFPFVRPTAIYLVDEAFAIVDADVREALAAPIEQLRKLFAGLVQSDSLDHFIGPVGGFPTLHETYCVLQWAEIGSSLGGWIADQRPEFGPVIAGSFELVEKLDRGRIRSAIELREAVYRHLLTNLEPLELLCIPTVTGSAPPKGTAVGRQVGNYYQRALSLTALAGIGRLPQVSLPLAATADSPVGLSLVGARGQDLFLLAVATEIEQRLK